VIPFVASLESILEQMKSNPQEVRFGDLYKIGDSWLGQARNTGSSHRIYSTSWRGDPRINIQNKRGMAKAYQVRQVLKEIALMGESDGKSN